MNCIYTYMCTHMKTCIYTYVYTLNLTKTCFPVYDDIAEYKIKFLVLEDFTAWIKQAVYWFKDLYFKIPEIALTDNMALIQCD